MAKSQNFGRRYQAGRQGAKAQRSFRWELWAVTFIVAAIGINAWGPVSGMLMDKVQGSATNAPSEAYPSMISARFSRCLRGDQTDCVIDGDTLRVGDMIVRIADIDTPEMSGYACLQEKARAEVATRRLMDLVNEGPFELGRYERDEDVYGRKLRVLLRNDKSLGATLVAEGLAHVWDGQKHPWC